MAVLAFLCLMVQSAWGLQYTNHVYDGSGKKTDLNYLMAQIEEGDVVIVGEKHGFFPHHETQGLVVQSLQNLGFVVDVGIEHVPYPLQSELDSYVYGKSTEGEFLRAIGWSKSKYLNCLDYTENDGFADPFQSTPFDCYIHTLRQASDNGGNALAINLPRSITGQVSRNGIDSLHPDDLAMLPPNYELGSDSYYQRFRELILSFGNSHGPISDEMIMNMFWSQSLWDESMSWQALEHMGKNPKNVMVITVGDFHAAYSDGLAARFYARGAKKVHVISQGFVENASQTDLDLIGQPSIKEGPAGDLVIITNVIQ